MTQIISGKVAQGKRKGRTLGFPTANIKIPENNKTESGVYAGWVEVDSQKYPAGIFVSPDGKILEAHILNFSEDLYGKNIVVTIERKIREVMKFTSDEELKKQVIKDLQILNDLFKNNH